MRKSLDAGFPDTEPAGSAVRVEPQRAGWPTRLLYCLSLAGLVVGSLAQASSWVGLALGGGLIGLVGPSVFLLVAAAVAYRIYRVLRYPQALDARPPYLLGWPLRWLGQLVMVAGAVGTVAQFVGKPLAMLLLKDVAESGNGVVLFVVGLYATILASVGWIGCVLFEASRAVGKRIAPPASGRSRRQWKQDMAVLAGLAAVALALPLASRLVGGDACLGKTLGGCAASVEGGVSRLAQAPVGASVGLRSDIDSIEFRQAAGRGWTLTERPAASLLKAGHSMAPDAAADVQVSLTAAERGQGVLLTLTVQDKGQKTAIFTTQFRSRAKLKTAADGKRKLVVDLERNVQPPLLARQEGDLLDEMHRQMRTAIGSPREVAEAAVRLNREARLVSTSALPSPVKIEDARPAKSCTGILKAGPGSAETELPPSSGSFLPQVAFVQQPAPAPTVLLYRNDRVSCHGGAVWFAADKPHDRVLQIRRYDPAAVLQRNLQVFMPVRRSGESAFVEEASLVENGGQVEFDLLVLAGTSYRREHFAVKMP